MNTSSMMNDINRRVIKALRGGMTVTERKALREKITREVIKERAKRSGLSEDVILERWNLAVRMGHSVETLERELGL